LFSRIVPGRLGKWFSGNRVINRVQAGFVRHKRTVNSTFMSKTAAEKICDLWVVTQRMVVIPH
jgi:hypothetical protein